MGVTWEQFVYRYFQLALFFHRVQVPLRTTLMDAMVTVVSVGMLSPLSPLGRRPNLENSKQVQWSYQGRTDLSFLFCLLKIYVGSAPLHLLCRIYKLQHNFRELISGHHWAVRWCQWFLEIWWILQVQRWIHMSNKSTVTLNQPLLQQTSGWQSGKICLPKSCLFPTTFPCDQRNNVVRFSPWSNSFASLSNLSSSKYSHFFVTSDWILGWFPPWLWWWGRGGAHLPTKVLLCRLHTRGPQFNPTWKITFSGWAHF